MKSSRKSPNTIGHDTPDTTKDTKPPGFGGFVTLSLESPTNIPETRKGLNDPRLQTKTLALLNTAAGNTFHRFAFYIISIAQKISERGAGHTSTTATIQQFQDILDAVWYNVLAAPRGKTTIQQIPITSTNQLDYKSGPEDIISTGLAKLTFNLAKAIARLVLTGQLPTQAQNHSRLPATAQPNQKPLNFILNIVPDIRNLDKLYQYIQDITKQLGGQITIKESNKSPRNGPVSTKANPILRRIVNHHDNSTPPEKTTTSRNSKNSAPLTHLLAQLSEQIYIPLEFLNNNASNPHVPIITNGHINPIIANKFIETSLFHPIATFLARRAIRSLKQMQGFSRNTLQNTELNERPIEELIVSAKKLSSDRLLKLLMDGRKKEPEAPEYQSIQALIYLLAIFDGKEIHRQLTPQQRYNIHKLIISFGQGILKYIIDPSAQSLGTTPSDSSTEVEAVTPKAIGFFDNFKQYRLLIDETISSMLLNTALGTLFLFPVFDTSAQKIFAEDFGLLYIQDTNAKSRNPAPNHNRPPKSLANRLHPEKILTTGPTTQEKTKIHQRLWQIHSWLEQHTKFEEMETNQREQITNAIYTAIFKNDPDIAIQALTKMQALDASIQSQNKTLTNEQTSQESEKLNTLRTYLQELTHLLTGAFWFQVLKENEISRIIASMTTRVDILGLEANAMQKTDHPTKKELIEQEIQALRHALIIDWKTGNHLEQAQKTQQLRIIIFFLIMMKNAVNTREPDFLITRQKGEGMFEWIERVWNQLQGELRISTALISLWGPILPVTPTRVTQPLQEQWLQILGTELGTTQESIKYLKKLFLQWATEQRKIIQATLLNDAKQPQ